MVESLSKSFTLNNVDKFQAFIFFNPIVVFMFSLTYMVRYIFSPLSLVGERGG